MKIPLHKKARATPAIRREIQASTLSERALAQQYGLNRATIRKWKNRTTQEDRSHRPHQLQTTLTPAQEIVAVELRRTLLLPLDDLLVVVREFLNPQVSRSGLDRCLRRHGVSNLAALRREQAPQETEEKPGKKIFKTYEPGFVHVDIKYLPKMPGETHRRYLIAGIDRATRWVYLEIIAHKTALNAAAFLKRLIAKAPFKITKLLTDNGKEFTNSFQRGGEQKPSNQHCFDQCCVDNAIEHRLIKPYTPQTNGMIERFNGRISEVLATRHFDSSQELEQTLKHYERIYNHHIAKIHHLWGLNSAKLKTTSPSRTGSLTTHVLWLY